MTLSAWLCTAAFVLFTLVCGVFIKSSPQRQSRDLCTAKLASAWICDQKIAIKQATVSELALIDGISVKSARRIVNFVQAQRDKSFTIDDLDTIKGIGPKTLVKIKEYFY